MKPLRALFTSGLLCAMVAVTLVQPVTAADEAKKQTESKEPATAAPSADASAQPSATLDLASDQVRLIMGGTAGKGVLHYQGKDYAFTFKSSSAGIGAKVVTKVSATGEVFGLNQVEDFAGDYTNTSKAALAGTAEVAASYKSDKGVEVKLRGTVEGAGLSFGAGMATITLVKQ